MKKTKNILVTVGIVILLAVIVYVRSRISPLIGNYSVEKSEKKVEAKPTMDTKAQETKKQEKMKTTKPQETKKPKQKSLRGKLRLYKKVSIRIGICKEVVKLNLMRVQVFMMNGEIFRL